jgi:hypothetical protein
MLDKDETNRIEFPKTVSLILPFAKAIAFFADFILLSPFPYSISPPFLPILDFPPPFLPTLDLDHQQDQRCRVAAVFLVQPCAVTLIHWTATLARLYLFIPNFSSLPRLVLLGFHVVFRHVML